MAVSPEASTGLGLFKEQGLEQPLTPRQQFSLNRLSQIKGRLKELNEKHPNNKWEHILLAKGIFALRRDLIEIEGFTPDEIDKHTPAKPILEESGIVLATDKTSNNAPKSK